MGRRSRESIRKKEKAPSVPEEQSEDDLLERIRRLEDENRRLKEEKERLEGENEIFRKYLKSKGMSAEDFLAEHKDLIRRVHMNSSNSSKPPSSDGYSKPSPKSLRRKTGKKRGGQPGHKGHNIVVPKETDTFVDHFPDRCSTCPKFEECKSRGQFEHSGSRKVLDLEIKLIVTEHRTYKTRCPEGSEKKIVGTFPEDVKATVQYGDSFAIAAGILDSYGYISDERIAKILGGISGTTMSPATVEAMTSKCAKKVKPVIEMIREALKLLKITHHDETGVRLNGILHWVHNTSDRLFTFQTIQRKRGKDGIDRHGAIPNPGGFGVHDCWSPYFKYDTNHALCCVHILRELRSVEENSPEHRWAGLFIEHLLFMKNLADAVRDCGRSKIDDSMLEYCSERYDEIMDLALDECPAPQDTHPHTRGRKKKGKERALIERLIDLKDCVCGFIHDLDVPFNNNQAERDVRYVKVKSKVSGGFGTMEKAQEFLDVSSYLITARKHGVSALKALDLAFKGQTDAIFSNRVHGAIRHVSCSEW